jgi:molybdopterin molybdotransferase
MLELEQAVEKILVAIPAPKSEMVPLTDAYGRIVAEKILAATDLPPFDNSAVDGYAVRAQDVASATAQNPVTLQLIGRVAAGEQFTGQLSAGQCIRIFTGSPVPAGADAVVMQEDTRSSAPDQTSTTLPNAGTTSPSPPRSGGEGRGEVVLRAHGEIQFLDSAKPWENIRFHGEDVKRGVVIVQPGERLGAAHLGLLAATGAGQVTVNRRPTIALLATGSELKEPTGAPSTGSASSPAGSAPLASGQIFESNRAALTPLIAATGAIPKIFPIVPDTAEATRIALERAFAECDIVITCGGVSVGEMDFVKSAFEALGGQLDFWKVALKPGRPFVFGRLGEKFLFGLPGNPISAFVTFLLLARPALLRWQGATNVSLPTSLGILAEPFSNPDHRRHFVRVTMDPDGKIHSAGTQASHILSSLASANGLIDLPPKTTLCAETTVKILRWE